MQESTAVFHNAPLINNIKNPELSFHKLSKDETLQRKWEKFLKTKGLMNIRQNSRVCSTHFPGGKKHIWVTFCQNVKVRRQLLRPEILPTVCKEECPENENIPTCNNRDVDVSEVDATTILPIISRESEEIDTLKTKCDALQKTIDAADKCSFRLERFIGSDHDF